MISTDCGQTYETIYSKSADELLTFDAPMLNPANFDAHAISPAAEDWRREVIDLAEFATETNVVLKFSPVSGLGGITYLDNVLLSNETTSVPELKIPELSLFPNPSSTALNIQARTDVMKEIVIRDMLGREAARISTINRSQVVIPVTDI